MQRASMLGPAEVGFLRGEVGSHVNLWGRNLWAEETVGAKALR